MSKTILAVPSVQPGGLDAGMGMRPLMGFNQMGIQVYFAGSYPTVGAAVQAFSEGKLTPFTMEHTCGGGRH